LSSSSSSSSATAVISSRSSKIPSASTSPRSSKRVQISTASETLGVVHETVNKKATSKKDKDNHTNSEGQMSEEIKYDFNFEDDDDDTPMVIAGSSAAKAVVDAAAVAAASAVAGKKRSRPSNSEAWGEEKTHGRSAPTFSSSGLSSSSTSASVLVASTDIQKARQKGEKNKEETVVENSFAPMVPEGFGSPSLGGRRSAKKENYVSIGMPDGIALGSTATAISTVSSSSSSMDIEEENVQPRSFEAVSLESRIPREPPIGTLNSVSLQFKMPDSSRILRRFNGSDSVSSLYQYAALRLLATPQWVANATHPLVSGSSTIGFDLSRIFPRESLLSKATTGISIQECGRLDKEVLLVTLK